MLRQNNAELQNAVQLLLAKKAGPQDAKHATESALSRPQNHVASALATARTVNDAYAVVTISISADAYRAIKERLPSTTLALSIERSADLPAAVRAPVGRSAGQGGDDAFRMAGSVG
jgi:hypothetical protein